MKENNIMATQTADLERGQRKAEVTTEISAADRAMGA
jgi:hypothetical protein